MGLGLGLGLSLGVGLSSGFGSGLMEDPVGPGVGPVWDQCGAEWDLKYIKKASKNTTITVSSEALESEAVGFDRLG